MPSLMKANEPFAIGAEHSGYDVFQRGTLEGFGVKEEDVFFAIGVGPTGETLYHFYRHEIPDGHPRRFDYVLAASGVRLTPENRAKCEELVR